MVEEWKDILNKFSSLCDDRIANAKSLKEKGKVIMGYTCSFVPEEIAYAGGFLPFRLTSGNVPVMEADAHIPNFYCSLVRTMLELGLKGSYDFLDGVIFPFSCDTMRNLYQIWKLNVPNALNFYTFIDTRMVTDPETEKYLITELEELIRDLDWFAGDMICHERIRAAIKVYNESRQLLAQLYELKAQEKPLLTGTEFFQIVQSSMVSPKDEHNALMRELLANLPESRPELTGKIRVLVSGGGIDNVEVIRMIEDAGMLIAGDDLCYGTRYFKGLVSEEGDPLVALAKRYLDKPQCPCRVVADPVLRKVPQEIERLGVTGVVFTKQQFCDAFSYDYVGIKNEMEKIGIPTLLVEMENTPGIMDNLRTRIQAYAEILQGKAKASVGGDNNG